MDYPKDELAARRRASHPATRIPSQSEYEMREAQEYHRQMTEPDRMPLSDRKETCALFLEVMSHQPDLVGERIGWIFNGSYGYGAQQAAERALANKRLNRAAIFTHMVGVLEWRCPQRMAIAAWKKLTAGQKKALDAAVKREMASAEKGEE